MSERPLSVGEAAERLGVDAKSVTRWCNEGKLAHFRLPGGHRRIPAAAVESIVASAR